MWRYVLIRLRCLKSKTLSKFGQPNGSNKRLWRGQNDCVTTCQSGEVILKFSFLQAGRGAMPFP